MKHLKAFVLVFVVSILTSSIITIFGLYTASKIKPPSPGNFSMFEGFQAAILAGTIYGAAIGIAIGLVSSLFYVAFVQNSANAATAIWAIVAFSLLVGSLECLFFFADNGIEFSEDKTILLYLLTSGFLTAFIPLIAARVLCKL